MKARTVTIFSAAAAIVLGIALSGCQNSPVYPAGPQRLIDDLEDRHILVSPLSPSSVESGENDIHFPSNTSVLNDLGSGVDIRGLKRKMKVGGMERNVLFAPPRSEYEMNVQLHEDSVLVFGAGIVKEGRPDGPQREQGNDERGINFRIILEMNGARKTIYQRYVNPPPREETASLTFHRERLELPGTGRKARLLFVTQGEQNAWSFWYNPVVYRGGSGARRVVLISIDTLRADHLGCYGYHRETSPAMDALAAEGTLFTRTYALSPWTLPSHVSMLTGLFGVNHQIERDSQSMDPALITMADVLRANGFFSSAFTGGGFVSSIYGFAKGFDSYSEGAGGVFRQDASERVFQLVSDWLVRHRDQDFFLFIHTYQPHSPYACPPPYKTMFLDEEAQWTHLDLMSHLGGKSAIFRSLGESERRNIIGLYDGEIRYTDEKLIAPLIAKLKDMGLYEETMIILTGDHGEEFYEHGGWGHGHSLYDESLRVPLIVKFPGGGFAGKRIDSTVSLVDILPTVIETFKLRAAGPSLDGLSLVPLVQGKDREERTFLAFVAENVLNSHIPSKKAVNKGLKKMIVNRRYGQKDMDFFLSPPPPVPSLEMYDLSADPEEMVNIVDDNPTLAASLRKMIDQVYAQAVVRESGKVEIDPRIREQLKALGYIR